MAAVSSRARLGGTFEMTGERFAALYAYGHELHVRYSPDEAVYEMNVGFGDLTTPQTLRLPEVTYEQTNVWTIMDPADTPYGADYPEATHALVSNPETFPGETAYLYYVFGTDALRFRAGVAAPADGSPPERVVGSQVVIAFPANADTYLYDERPESFDGVDGLIYEEVGMHGFGTFEVDGATAFEMGAFFLDHYWYDPDDADGDAYGFSEYSIIGDDGSLVFFNIAANPTGGPTEIEGDVYITWVDYVQVVAPTVAEAVPEAGPSWTTYPNPAADVVRFSEALDVTLYDVLGRAVRSGDGVRSLDVAGLPAGLYLARTPDGASRPLTLR